MRCDMGTKPLIPFSFPWVIRTLVVTALYLGTRTISQVGMYHTSTIQYSARQLHIAVPSWKRNLSVGDLLYETQTSQ